MAARADTGHFVSERISRECEPPSCEMVHVTFERPAEAHLCTRMTFSNDQSVDATLYPRGRREGGVGLSQEHLLVYF